VQNRTRNRASVNAPLVKAPVAKKKTFYGIDPRLKAALVDSKEQLDVVKRENKNLADEIRDIFVFFATYKWLSDICAKRHLREQHL
jgi:hypothetical protein